MHHAQNLAGAQHTPQTLDKLEAVRENLLALSDDTRAGIDRQGLAAPRAALIER